MASATAVSKQKVQRGADGQGKQTHPKGTAQGEDTQLLLVSQEIMRLVEASQEGRLSERARVEKFEGVYGEMMQGLNAMLDAILLPIGEGNRILAQISGGKIDELIAQTYKGDHEKMKQAVNNVAVVLQSLQKELVRLTDASKEGQLSDRGKPEQFQGAYAEIVRGVNAMLDAILLPIGEGNRILAQISGGKIDELIAQTYKGDHEKMKLAVNNVAMVLQRLQKELVRLDDASKQGQLSERGKAEQFQGAYAEIVRGVNAMLDAILLPIGEGNRILAQISGGKIDELIAQTYKGDHEKMKQAVNNVALVLQSLQKELVRLTDASKEGQLSDRGKPEQFQGAYAEIVRGVNAMLDAILLPIGEGNRILAQVSGGKIDELIAQTYKGDHEKMKQAINNVALVLQGLQKELLRLSEAASAGQLSERGRHDQFRGAYAEIVRGVNGVLDAVIAPLNVSANYVDRISKGDVPPQITDTYHGDFNLIKNNLNTLINAMNEITHAADEISHGNLTVSIQERSPQDKLMQALGAMVQDLTRTVSEIRNIAGEVSSASQSISTASVQISNGATTQAASAEEASSFDGGDGFQHQAERRQRAANRQDRQQVGQGRAGKRPGGGGSGDRDEGNRQQDFHHRGDCPPDQPAGAERGHRSGSGRGTRQGIRRGGGRSPQAGRTQPKGGGRNQSALRHHGQGFGEGGRDAREAGARHPEDGRTGAGDHGRQQGTGYRGRADQQGAAATGEGHPAERLRLGRNGVHDRGADRASPTS